MILFFRPFSKKAISVIHPRSTKFKIRKLQAGLTPIKNSYKKSRALMLQQGTMVSPGKQVNNVIHNAFTNMHQRKSEGVEIKRSGKTISRRAVMLVA